MPACFISGCTRAEIVPRTDNGEERARVLQRVRARQDDLHRHRGTLSPRSTWLGLGHLSLGQPMEKPSATVSPLPHNPGSRNAH